MIAFSVEGIPKGQPRPRAYKRGARAGVYNPRTPESVAWTIALQTEIAKIKHDKPLMGPISLELQFRMPRPKSHYVAGNPERTLKANAPYEHTSKPDIDNLAKCVIDRCTELKLWHDDDQIWHLEAKKVYHAHPGVTVWIGHAANSDTNTAKEAANG